jgi:endonuclease/exonuclease/phosphatase family metal-dependent hydrolase
LLLLPWLLPALLPLVLAARLMLPGPVQAHGGHTLTAASIGPHVGPTTGENFTAASTTAAVPLNVMTRNLYLGADVGPLFTAQDLDQYFAAVASTYQQVQASNIPERAAGIAKEVAQTQPDIISLQEVTQWSTGPLFAPAAATTVTIDALQSLLASLSALHLHYQPVVVLHEGDFEAPAPALNQDIRLLDRDVILARNDLPPSQLKLSTIQSSHFTTLLTFPTIIGPITIPRGWESVDVTRLGKTVRIVNTHLEALEPNVQRAQGQELLAGPASTSRPLILAGDFNTGPGAAAAFQPTYNDLLNVGLRDTWGATNPGKSGYTWPVNTGDSHTATTPTQRIDLVLVRGGVRPVLDVLVGNRTPQDLTPSGLWRSDHAGVAALCGV